MTNWHFDSEDKPVYHPFPLPDKVEQGALDFEDVFDQYDAHYALDELFGRARKYRTGEEYLNLLSFVRKFRFYSPYNAMLIYAQRPGATYVAPASRWLRDYGRQVTADATPIVILRPRGPVMFVFDVGDTEPLKDAPPLPKKITQPFEIRGGKIGFELERAIENALRDGISVSERKDGSQRAGSIQWAKSGLEVTVKTKRRPTIEYKQLTRYFEVLLNSSLSAEAKYATLAHELGHLYCGHLGSPNEKWWNPRPALTHTVREFEAESVCYLVCGRLGIDNPSDEYLAGFFKTGLEVPSISLETVTKAAGLVERMSQAYLPLRKETD